MFAALVLALCALSAHARPAARAASATALDPTSLSAFERPALFSRIAYCSTANVSIMACGAPCDALPGVTVLATGGDGDATPNFLVAHDPVANAIVVAHEGTDSHEILSIANDVKFNSVALNATRFPGAKGVEVHDGFQDAFERTADAVLAAVKAGLAATGTSTVTVTGHSLGAALATLDALHFAGVLPGVTINTAVFGLPRVGNKAFADLVDASLPGFTHITNQHDPVPTVPPQLLGFQHPGGEVHITAVDKSGQATAVLTCPGQENNGCSDGNSLLDASVSNHKGPYFDNISFGNSQCPF